MSQYDFTKPLREVWGKGKGKVGDVGIEIEAELNAPFQPETISEFWRGDHDGSLRGNGIEFILNNPIKMKDVSPVLREWEEWVKGYKYKKSPRTSVHVHFNMLDYTFPQIFNFLSGYWLLEEWIGAFCGPSRKGNIFCLSSLRANDLHRTLVYWLKTGQGHLANILHPDIIKYSAINPSPLLNFGSVEVRTMRGVYDREIIEQWVNELWRLKEHCVAFKNPKEMLQFYQKTPKREWLEQIFSPDFFREVMSLHNGNNSWEQHMNKAFFDFLSLANAKKDWAFVPKPRDKQEIRGAKLDVRHIDDIQWNDPFDPLPLVPPVPPEEEWKFAWDIDPEDEPEDWANRHNLPDAGRDQFHLNLKVHVRNPIDGDL